MNAEIISVGTELLMGDILNTNTQYLSKELLSLGINVFYHQSVADDKERLKEAVKLALSRSDVVITVAGLGPTDDDITCETVCNALGVQMTYDSSVETEIRAYFEARRKEMPESNMKQAVVPLGATILHNSAGTAPGSIVEVGDKCVIMLPGPPHELKAMFQSPEVMDKLSKYSDGAIFTETLKVIGMGESEVEMRLKEFFGQSNPVVATYAKTGEVEVKITATGEDIRSAQWVVMTAIEGMVTILDHVVYAAGSTDIQEEVVNRLIEKGLKISTAESCTAGMLSKMITDVPGASDVFEMGVTTYSADMKKRLLGVSSETLEETGEVSPDTAREMAVGVLLKSNSDIGVGITGIAGPDGGTPEKPVGLVYISVADRENVYAGMINLGNREREYIRTVAVKSALDMVRRIILGYTETLGEPAQTEVIASYLEDGMPLAHANASSNSSFMTPGFNVAEYNENDDFGSVDISSDGISSVAPHEKTEEERIAEELAVAGVLPESAKARPEVSQLFGKEAMFMPKQQNGPLVYENPEQSENEGSLKEKLLGIFKRPKKEKKAKDAAADLAVAGDAAETGNLANQPKKKWYKRLFAWLIPQKGDGKFGVFMKIFRLICILVLIGCAVWGGFYLKDVLTYEVIIVDDDPTQTGTNELGILKKYEKLYEQNKDMVGYLQINDIDATGPVVQSDDNDYYLNHDFLKNKTRFGARFADSSNVFKNDGTLSQNTIIYGHYSNDGKVFGSLEKYRDLDFYKAHSTIKFDTIYEEAEWKVLAVFITNTHLEDDIDKNDPAKVNGYSFPYRTIAFADQDAFLDFVVELRHRSIINTNVDVVPNDQLLTLSTCSRIFKDARLVVVARRVREGESPSVDLNNVAVNPIPLYPQVWYEKVDKNAVKPVFGDNNQVVTTTTTTTQATTLPSSSTETTTMEPITMAPTQPTQPPATQPPVTQPPETQPPATQPPETTQPPTTKIPETTTTTTTKAPVTFPPITTRPRETASP